MVRRLSREEVLTLFMLASLSLMIILTGNFHQAYHYFLLNLILVFIIGLITFLPPSWQWVRDWYIIIYLVVIFFETGTLVPLVNPHDMDDFLARVDRALFGGEDPSLFIGRYMFPLFAEVLQIIYASFYFMPFLLCVLLYVKKRDKNPFHLSAFAILLGFYVSYLGYFLCPALGPRFYLEHLQEKPLSGIWSFDYVRNFLAWMEGKMYDCMPSGHALVALLSALLARRYLRYLYPVFAIWAALMILSTFYLRYHYLIDVVIGIALAVSIYFLVPQLEKRNASPN